MTNNMENTMANKINDMGNEVVEGFTCKPKDFDPNRPIMHYKSLLMICDDERCSKAGGGAKAEDLRNILKDMGLNQGKNRIKKVEQAVMELVDFVRFAKLQKIHKLMETLKIMHYG